MKRYEEQYEIGINPGTETPNQMAKGYRDEQGNDDWDNVNARYAGKEKNDAGLPSRGIRQGEQETDGAGSLESTEENRSTRSQLAAETDETYSPRPAAIHSCEKEAPAV